MLSIAILSLISILLWFRRRSWGIFELSEIRVERIMMSLGPNRHVLRRRRYIYTLGRIRVCRNVGCHALSRQRWRYVLKVIIMTVCTRRRQRNARMLSLRKWKV